ncbi:Uncharacterised protein [Vibrio cholerae]|nr:Uncharacterised protein [Vibrio cholerae]
MLADVHYPTSHSLARKLIQANLNVKQVRSAFHPAR